MSKVEQLIEQLGPRFNESMGKGESKPAQIVDHPAVEARFVGRTKAKEVAQIELERIIVDPQHRERFDESDISSLAQDLLAHGLIQPIVVRWDSQRKKYVIIAGERRYRAAKQASWTSIECKIKPENTSQAEVAELQLSENFARKNLNPIELAKAFREVIDKNGCTARDLAKKLGVNETTITRQLRFLTLPKNIQLQIANGEISKTLGRELVRVEDPQRQIQLLEMANSGVMTTNEVTQEIQQSAGNGRRRRRRPQRQALRKLEFASDYMQIRITKIKDDATYHHVAELLQQALEEVQTRIRGRVRLSK